MPRTSPVGSMIAAQLRPRPSGPRRANPGWSQIPSRRASPEAHDSVLWSMIASRLKLNPVSPSSGSSTYVPASTPASPSIRSIVAWLAGLSSQATSNWTAATRMLEV